MNNFQAPPLFLWFFFCLLYSQSTWMGVVTHRTITPVGSKHGMFHVNFEVGAVSYSTNCLRGSRTCVGTNRCSRCLWVPLACSIISVRQHHSCEKASGWPKSIWQVRASSAFTMSLLCLSWLSTSVEGNGIRRESSNRLHCEACSTFLCARLDGVEKTYNSSVRMDGASIALCVVMTG